MTQAQLQTFLTGQLDQLFQVTNAASFIRTWGCPSFHQQGLGVDYDSEATYFEVGGSASSRWAWTELPARQHQGYPTRRGSECHGDGGASLAFLGFPDVFGNWMQVPTTLRRR